MNYKHKDIQEWVKQTMESFDNDGIRRPYLAVYFDKFAFCGFAPDGKYHTGFGDSPEEAYNSLRLKIPFKDESVAALRARAQQLLDEANRIERSDT